MQSWRTSQFEEHEAYLQIEILLNEVDGQTELTLFHTNVPESGEHFKKGWDHHSFPINERIFFKIKNGNQQRKEVKPKFK